jgi:peptidoglycan hydrolase-like protein with peptidoglycan-binding domain
MARNARRPKARPTYMDVAGTLASAVGQRISDNPAMAGSAVAFAVVMFYVSTNALYYQPYQHKDALFSTRSMNSYIAPDLPKPMAALVTKGGKSESFKITREDGASPSRRQADPTLADIQSALAELNLYSGSVDGLPGPKTREAIEKFQREAGLEPTGQIDPLLIDAIRTASIPVEKVPAPAARTTAATNKVKPQVKPEPVETAAAKEPVGQLESDDLMRLQAGLKAFGNDSIEVDGKIGSKTRVAIKEFQTLFRLTVSGEPNREVLQKLQEIGLVAG